MIATTSNGRYILQLSAAHDGAYTVVPIAAGITKLIKTVTVILLDEITGGAPTIKIGRTTNDDDFMGTGVVDLSTVVPAGGSRSYTANAFGIVDGDTDNVVVTLDRGVGTGGDMYIIIYIEDWA